MPWKECTTMSSRREFVLLAQRSGANLAQLCRNFGISRKTAYKWIERHRAEGMGGLQDRSRRPHCSPDRSTPELEAQILELNDRNPYWGSRKLRALLATDGPLPHHSTIDAILPAMAGKCSRAARTIIVHRAASNTQAQICCGKWTLKGISR